ncbi:OLC1v1028744C1 [Oldenlandia corymbosa var. corymbosa]|uniref:OLC1v1028744C1 n=1 Tax=Oldenlandia corymbosa var. corymbosa TaxID=529605 RepID=A0AAV1CEZ6_OLDCO|nr:OLC1v1028744C1 [Oldenlandia corymbosa var. corymbosa]
MESSENDSSPDHLLQFSDERTNSKRLKRMDNFDDLIGDDYHSNVGYRRDMLYNDRSSMMINGSTAGGKKNELFREHIWAYSQKYLEAASAIEGEASSSAAEEDKEYTIMKETDERGENQIKLVQLLVACAEAVAYRDKHHASTLIADLRAEALVLGTAFQRVASCFVKGLCDRLALVQPHGAVGDIGAIPKTLSFSIEKEEAASLVYQICPQIQFGHYVANASILQAFEGESSNNIHVLDLGMTMGLRHGYQWRSLIFSLATRAGRPCHCLRITGIGSCPERFQAIGDELEQYAHKLGIKLEFSVVESSLENIRPEDLKIIEDEFLVINSILELHCVVKESRGALNSVLKMLNKLSPKALFILVEQESSHNGPFFLGRFMEALYYYSAIFDSLDAMLPRYDTRRAKIEQFYFGEEIKNIVSCEGPARVERHERLDQWRRRMGRAGFQLAPIKMLTTQAKQWLESVQVCEGYNIAEEKGCLVLAWKSKSIIAASCWKCS